MAIIEVGKPSGQTIRHHLSTEHLFASYEFALHANALQPGSADEYILALKARTHAIGAITCATSFLESCINEVLSECSLIPAGVGMSGEWTPKGVGAGVHSNAVTMLGALWRRKMVEWSNILEKYQLTLELADRPLFDRGQNPYQDVALLIDLRNDIVHFKPEERAYSNSPSTMNSFERALAPKFEENPFEQRLPVPFFPARLLGPGCATWSYKTALKFVEEFFKRLGIRWGYRYLLESGIVRLTD